MKPKEMTSESTHAGPGLVPSFGFFGQGNSTGLLLVAVLLCMLLLSRVHREERGRRRPARKAPLSPEELGHFVFEAGRSANIELYRGLYLSGGEARSLMGEQAADYLDRRDPRVIEESLLSLGACLLNGSVFECVESKGEGEFSIRFRLPDGIRSHLDIGSAVKVGAIWRLRDPPIMR